MQLSTLQKKFCELYVVSGNATQAYIDAGYKVKSERAASSAASRLLGNVKVKAYIKELTEAAKTEAIMGEQEVLAFLSDVIQNKVTETVVVGSKNGAEEVERTPSVADRVRAAAEILKRHPIPQDINVNTMPNLKITIGDYPSEPDG